MGNRSFVVLGTFPGMNEYSNAQRTHFHKGAAMKKKYTDIVHFSDSVFHAEPIPSEGYPLRIDFLWFEKNRRRDPDNIASAKKFILDGLQKAGVLSGDGWKQIFCLTDSFFVDKDDPRVEIEIFFDM